MWFLWFLLQAEGIANGGNLEPAYLDGIYDRIKVKAIQVENTDLRG